MLKRIGKFVEKKKEQCGNRWKDREYIGRSFVGVAVGEEDEYTRGKVVDVVKSDSFNSVHFQHCNH